MTKKAPLSGRKMHSQLRFPFLMRLSKYACEVVKPKVGRMTTMKRRYQKVFFMMAWFCPDRVQWPTSRSAQPIRTCSQGRNQLLILPFSLLTGNNAVKLHNINVGKKSVIHDGRSLKYKD